MYSFSFYPLYLSIKKGREKGLNWRWDREAFVSKKLTRERERHNKRCVNFTISEMRACAVLAREPASSWWPWNMRWKLRLWAQYMLAQKIYSVSATESYTKVHHRHEWWCPTWSAVYANRDRCSTGRWNLCVSSLWDWHFPMASARYTPGDSTDTLFAWPNLQRCSLY